MPRVPFEAQIRVLHPRVDAASVRRSKKSSQPKIVAPHAPFVIERRLIGRDDASSSFDKSTNLVALRIGKRRDIRKYQDFELVDMRGIEKTVVHHLKWDARLDQRLIVTER